ncbi:MAG: 6-pyruvoyl tetrahydropterin synthase [Cyanobacteria bacterium]|nr:6-pyruvoyl tetrahydropterin synthase [Cyanobacteria bacterium CG_2015-16_32_12]NCO78379.1 6-pyruvoyl tetrahydropterin synthase [Cyanobacteria bacterium CG_2015-22_32_23]NCQ02948.1 6-pyruvoyl tetrahydropterin synthase [Cyanobacteria bacterium CG_2015-09_32_10]NCQ41845.1 6-pyruvoyl tetrahydropterin synthase [Cyanobacteria bacterium CG_2015-04_32_10]NCS85880.1 6-pyruvoyl tetrahydropterin synthase [Cyanobacteria bacterium CG_2015-02_32_10]
MECIVNRRAKFSASHRYWLPELSETENQNKFGANSRFPGHGHNYVLYVSIMGELDKYGMVQNLSNVKKVIKQEVTSQLDYSYLNDTWAEFQVTLPTTENIAKVIWERLSPHLPLVDIQLYEHSSLWVNYQGKNMEATLTVQTHFSAAHRLALPELSFEANSEIYGKCARPNGHGHNYHLEVSVTGEMDSRTGMIIDLVALQKVIDDYVVEPFDHTFLNKDIPYFATVVPTAENIAVYIAQLLQEPISKLGAELDKVKLIESPNNSCEIFCRKSSLNNSSKNMSKTQPVLV